MATQTNYPSYLPEDFKGLPSLPAVKTTADSALQPETTFVTEGGTSYTAAQLLQAVAELMGKNLVTQ